MNLINFKKVFDSVDRNVIWLLVGRVPPKFIKLIQELYEALSCPVIHDGKLSEPFKMNIGVHQGCFLPTMIVIMVADWIMREVESDCLGNSSKQWTLTTQSHDLDYCLISNREGLGMIL